MRDGKGAARSVKLTRPERTVPCTVPREASLVFGGAISDLRQSSKREREVRSSTWRSKSRLTEWHDSLGSLNGAFGKPLSQVF